MLYCVKKKAQAGNKPFSNTFSRTCAVGTLSTGNIDDQRSMYYHPTPNVNPLKEP